MSPAVITALCTGIVGVLGAIGSLAALFLHVRNNPGEGGPKQ